MTPPTGSGSLADLDTALNNGVTYNPGTTPPSTDKVTLTVTDDHGATDTVNFVFNQAGEGAVTLTGTAGKDVIFGSGNGDTLTGNGGQDQFVFSPTSSPTTVQHTITDFDVNLDKIDVRQFHAITASALAAMEGEPGSVPASIASACAILAVYRARCACASASAAR